KLAKLSGRPGPLEDSGTKVAWLVYRGGSRNAAPPASSPKTMGTDRRTLHLRTRGVTSSSNEGSLPRGIVEGGNSAFRSGITGEEPYLARLRRRARTSNPRTAEH